jgi:hypothetical protein
VTDKNARPTAGEAGALTPRQIIGFTAFVLLLFVGVPVTFGGSPYFITVLTNAAVLSFISPMRRVSAIARQTFSTIWV